MKLLAAILLFAALWLGLSSRSFLQVDLTNVLHPPALGLSWLVTALFVVSSVGIVFLVAIAAVWSHRMEIFRDLGVAAALAWGASVTSQHFLGVSARFPASEVSKVHGVNLGFPVPIIAASVAVVLAALPYLSRNFQRFLEISIAIGLLTGLIEGIGLPVALAASVVVGWGASAVTHLIFGSPTGVPGADVIAKLLEALGVHANDVAPLPRQQWGLARFSAVDDDGQALRVSLYGRDARDSQLFSKVYRMIWLRNDVGPFVLTRTQQIDHECYMTLLADQASPKGVSTVVASGFVGGAKEGLVVSSVPAAPTLAELIEAGTPVSDELLASMAHIVSDIHGAGVSHGSIDPDRFVVEGYAAVLVDFDRARRHAPDEACNQDAAALLVTLALASSAERAVSAAREAFGDEKLEAALAYVQRPALPPSLAAMLRHSKEKLDLKALREEAASTTGTELVKLAELKRVSWTNLILGIGTLIGGWALIGVLLHVAQAFSTIKSANWAWVAATAIVAQVAYLGSAMSSMGSVVATLPYFPLVILELSNTFSGLALGTPAVLAARIRFFQTQGVDTTVAVSSGVLVSTASWIVKGGLFLISLPFALGTIHISQMFKDSSSGSNSGSHQGLLTFVLIVVVGIGVLVAVVLAVPRWRGAVKAKVVPKMTEAVDHFKVITKHPRKVVQIFGGMLIAQLSIALALGTSLHAFNVRLSLPVILVVLTLGSMLGGLSPVPGGMGVVEAGMILGLRAAGVPSDEAVAAVFVQRLFTAYLPPIAGWFCLIWLRKREYL